jgi:uncharacterized protein
MSRAPSDQVDAVLLAARAATVQAEFAVEQLPRLAEAGAQPGTLANATLRFSTFEGKPAIDVHVAGHVVLNCQRCLQPVRIAIDESAALVVVPTLDGAAATGFEPYEGDAEHLPLAALVEEQVLLGMPLVPMHEEGTPCAREAARARPLTPDVEVQVDRQRPFANLRQLLDTDER